MSKQIVKKTETNITDRTPQLIAAEIRSIDTQVKEMVLHGSINIGKKLIEAKTLVAHGEWGKWVVANLEYSHSQVNNFMRIAEEYGSVNSQALGNLSFTQAVALLGMPTEDKEAFVESNNVENMSTRELQKAVKEKQELERKLNEEQAKAEQEKKQREAVFEQYQTELSLRKSQEQQINDLQQAVASSKDDKTAIKLKDDLKSSKEAHAVSIKRIKELEDQLNAKPIDVPVKEIVEVIPEETQKELDSLRKREQELELKAKQQEEATAKQISEMKELLEKNNNTAAIKVKVCFDTLVSNFKELLSAVAEVSNEEEKVKFQGAMSKLCDKMKEQL
ncbi:DUF3102 domain-containing protein [Paenibacillus alba]|uniref:DUF3102 domain-containing protein n=1 Tax=Paenibacillus alba TaxID=1197127 RepID=UPI001565D516|nr:DUF3102 domain-containing protein [Paenibacillus alba]NQX67959.1 DUF3102 domain-containing protein [Paenibacillus alba]